MIGHTLERALEVWMMVLGLVATELNSGAEKQAALGGASRPWVGTSGVALHVFGAAHSSWVLSKRGIPGKAGHRLPLPEAEACPGVDIV